MSSMIRITVHRERSGKDIVFSFESRRVCIGYKQLSSKMEQCLRPDVQRTKHKPAKPPQPPPKPPKTVPPPKPTSEVNGNVIQKERTALLPPHMSRNEQHLSRKSNDARELNLNLQENNDDTGREIQSQNEEKGMFSGIFQNVPKDRAPTFTSYITDIHPEKEESQLGKQEKGGMFSGMFKKSPKPADRTIPVQEEESVQSESSASKDNLSDIGTKVSVSVSCFYPPPVNTLLTIAYHL
ncbi:hypothetical protein COCON_G00137420 [Conger conger]|uniref:Uncharacterized protein n=1 Tax=Conger conger TaxID=82655 RepID=A0A9Q1HX88_CONCO|nr:hypothetical protein COCON_G00137420 [Conger conger]